VPPSMLIARQSGGWPPRFIHYGVFIWGQSELDRPSPLGFYSPMVRVRPRLSGFIEPCLPSPAPNPPAGEGWIHEIKLDGFRMLARRDGACVRLLTRRGIDWTTRYPAIAAAIAALACRSCLIDGEVVICGEDGIPVFDRLRYGRQPQSEAVLFAFDLIELGGKDLRRTQLEERIWSAKPRGPCN
jgi:ATP-dependent DNA ligase